MVSAVRPARSPKKTSRSRPARPPKRRPSASLRVYDRLVPGTFLSRPNRFVAKVRVRGRTIPCHVPDPGRLEELLVKGARVLLAPGLAGGRTTESDLVLVRHKGIWVSVNSQLPTAFVRHLLENRILPEFSRYTKVEPEVNLGHSRLDFLLRSGESRCYVEVKGASLVVGRRALFPDAPTERGSRHLAELAQARHRGDRACVLFIIQRPDADRFSPNATTDPEFAMSLAVAAAKGVEVYAYTTRVKDGTISLGRKVQVELAPSSAA